jgi:Arc/MetJ-type ribon-helix-helix transcriptional regulator
MTTMTFELPESMKSRVEQRAASCNFPDASAYLRSLIALDLRRDEIDQMLIEAEDAYERGEYTEWKPGDSRRMLDELLRQRQQSTKS